MFFVPFSLQLAVFVSVCAATHLLSVLQIFFVRLCVEMEKNNYDKSKAKQISIAARSHNNSLFKFALEI